MGKKDFWVILAVVSIISFVAFYFGLLVVQMP